MLRLAIDMNSTRLAPGESLVFTFSDQIEIDGWKITLTAKPAPIKLTMQKREFEQSWDFLLRAVPA